MQQDPLKNLTLLQIAIGRRHEGVVRLLVEQGADITRSCPDSFARVTTPLHVASALGFVATVHLLLEKGAKLEAPDNYQQTPLHYAVKLMQRMPMPRHNLAAVETLLKMGALHNARDEVGRTPEDLLRTRDDCVGSHVVLLLLLPQKSRYHGEPGQGACSMEKKVRRLFEAKRAVLDVVRWAKDRKLRKEKSRTDEQSRKDLVAQKRERRSQNRRDKATHGAEKTEMQRLIVEADKQQAMRANETQREAEAIQFYFGYIFHAVSFRQMILL